MLLYADNRTTPTTPCVRTGTIRTAISDGEINGGLSHEHNESVTDPMPNDAWTNGVGVTTGKRSAICASAKGTPLGTAPNGASTTR